MQLVLFQLHHIKIPLADVQKLGNIFLTYDMAALKRRTFMLAGHDLGNIVG